MDPHDPCAGCGRCCATQGTPPGFAGAYARSPYADPADQARYDDAPEAARRLLADHFAALIARRVRDRYGESLPCLWYDADVRRCRWHAWRPEACREFTPGEPACGDYRTLVGLPLIPAPPGA